MREIIRAIVADDEFETREGLRDLIPWESLGVDCVDMASDGDEAVELSQRLKPDIIISDIRMPKVNGIAFVENIKKILPASKIIFISGYSDKEYLKSAIRLKAISYIEKPINLDEIISAISEAVETLKAEKSAETMTGKKSSLCRDIALELIDSNVKTSVIRKNLNDANPKFLLFNSYCTLIFKIGAQELPVGNELKAYGEAKVKVIEDSINDVFTTYLASNVEGVGYVVHVCDPSIYNGVSFRNSLQEVMDSIAKSFNMRAEVFMAVGQCVSVLEYIKDSYQTALVAARQFFFTGYNTTIKM